MAKYRLILNEDKDFVTSARGIIEENGGICPYEDSKCPCEKVLKTGKCQCTLYTGRVMMTDKEVLMSDVLKASLDFSVEKVSDILQRTRAMMGDIVSDPVNITTDLGVLHKSYEVLLSSPKWNEENQGLYQQVLDLKNEIFETILTLRRNPHERIAHGGSKGMN